MRYFLAALCWLGLGVSHVSTAQVVRSIPRFPVDTDTVTIFFDATQGNGALANVAPPIYAHTGVITSQSTGPSDWRNVQGTWGQASPNTLMTPLGNNRYSISYVPRTFYGTSTNVQMLSLAFVFRNTSGNIVGRESDGSDIFLPLYAPGQLHSRIFSPAGSPLVSPNSNISFFGASSQVCTLSLFVNGNQVQSVVSDSLAMQLPIGASGNYQLVFRADNGSTVKNDTLNVVALPSLNVQALPVGIRDGINYINDSTITLALFAPHKQHVFVLGDFNDWKLDATYFMNRTPDSNWYWRTITGLTPGVEYAFQYLVDGSLRVADPLAEKILDPNNDRFIAASTYPNLKPYPTGKTSGIVGVLQTNKPAYVWRNNNFQRPANKDLFIYELLIRDFIADQRYLSVIDSLDYLKRMGVNVLKIMPITEFEGNNSWGYNPIFMLAPDKAYGTDADLKTLIDSCHGKGIAVVLDMVLNHAFGQSPLSQLWWDGANNRPAANSPYFNPVPTHDFNVGMDFNHESPATKRFVNRVLHHWLEEYRFDGYRFDLSKGFTQRNTLGNIGAWNAYDSSRVALWKGIHDTMQAISPNSYVILEHLSDNPEERELANYGMMFWGNMNHNFGEGTMGFTGNSSLTGSSHKARGWSKPHLIAYAESHDEERLMYRTVNFGSTSGTTNARQFGVAIKRMELVPVFLLSIPGPKMIWQFGELGYDFSINRCPNGTISNNCRTDPKPIRWDYFTHPDRRYLYNIYSAMGKLRAEQEAFATDSFLTTLGGAYKVIRLFHPSMDVVTIGNWSTSANSGNVSFSRTGMWYEYFSGDSLNVTDLITNISLDPGAYRIYTSKRLAQPDLSLNQRELAGRKVLTVYPNPASEGVYVDMGIQEQAGQLIITDLQGRQIAILPEEQADLPAGIRYWDLKDQRGNRVTAGLYLVRSQSGATSKIVVQ